MGSLACSSRRAPNGTLPPRVGLGSHEWARRVQRTSIATAKPRALPASPITVVWSADPQDWQNAFTKVAQHDAPQGFLLQGRISPSASQAQLVGTHKVADGAVPLAEACGTVPSGPLRVFGSERVASDVGLHRDPLGLSERLDIRLMATESCACSGGAHATERGNSLVVDRLVVNVDDA